MRPERGRGGLVVFLLIAMAFVGCSRVTFLRPDVSRGDFRRTAPDIEIRSDGHGRAGALALVQAARARLMTGDAASAHGAAARAVRLDGTLAEAHSLLGLSLDALGRAREAGASHRRAAELAPADGGLSNNYGIWLCANGRAAESLAWFDRALAAPGYSTPDVALANAGACALETGDLDRASSLLRRALEVAPASPLALGALAAVEYRRGRMMEARAFIQRRLAAAPADAESLLLASQIEERLGDMAAATRYVQRMRAEFPLDSGSAPEGGNR